MCHNQYPIGIDWVINWVLIPWIPSEGSSVTQRAVYHNYIHLYYEYIYIHLWSKCSKFHTHANQRLLFDKSTKIRLYLSYFPIDFKPNGITFLVQNQIAKNRKYLGWFDANRMWDSACVDVRMITCMYTQTLATKWFLRTGHWYPRRLTHLRWYFIANSCVICVKMSSINNQLYEDKNYWLERVVFRYKSSCSLHTQRTRFLIPSKLKEIWS